MQRLVVATNNSGKLMEIRELLASTSFTLLSLADFNVPDVAEDGLTFIENALIKARHAAQHTKLPALADDSGLCVQALNNAPGIYSARYAGSQATDADRINKLLKALDDTQDQQRLANFYCAMALVRYPEDPAPLIGLGSWPGRILTTSVGKQGFGYDPVFYALEQGCSAAELEPMQKNRISHRGKAITQLLQSLEQVDKPLR